MIPIAASLEPAQLRVFEKTFQRAIGVTTALFGLFGALCYLAWGDGVKMPVTLSVRNGGANDAATAALQLAYCVAVVCTYPLQLVPVAHMLEEAFATPPSRLASLPPLTRRLLARLLLLTATCAAAVLGASKFDHFVGLVGACCSVPLAFVLPSLIYLCVSGEMGSSSALLPQLRSNGATLLARLSILVGLLGSILSGASVIATWTAS